RFSRDWSSDVCSSDLAEYAFVRDIVQRAGIETLVIDTGVLNEPVFRPDISSEQVAAAAGSSVRLLREQQDRGRAVAAMTEGVAEIGRASCRGRGERRA